jgi:hypothetical protein
MINPEATNRYMAVCSFKILEGHVVYKKIYEAYATFSKLAKGFRLKYLEKVSVKLAKSLSIKK